MTATTTIVSASPEDTEVAGERLGRTLGPGDVFGFDENLCEIGAFDHESPGAFLPREDPPGKKSATAL